MNARNPSLASVLTIAAVALTTGCDVDQSFAFPEVVEGVPGVQHLGEVIVADIPSVGTDEMAAALEGFVVYGEVGPTGTPEYGGVTFDITGDGGNLCVWIDPEGVSWNQSVSPTSPNEGFTWPDNLFDDGDLDIDAGLSVYYTGSPGERIGNFEVLYEDDLGVSVPIELVECEIVSDFFDGGFAHGGRAVPEFCTIENTIENASYTVLLESFSLPQDDDRLAYGLLVTRGTCDDLLSSFGLNEGDVLEQECVIRGEALQPGAEQGAAAAAAGYPSPTWLGGEQPTWDGMLELEEAFCAGDTRTYCVAENNEIAQGGDVCSEFNDPQQTEGQRRCFCGDILDTPSGGAF